MLKCKVCGFEFEAKSENRYTSRSGGRDGLFSAAMSKCISLTSAFMTPSIALRVGVSTWHRSAIMLSLLHAGKKKITKKRKM